MSRVAKYCNFPGVLSWLSLAMAAAGLMGFTGCNEPYRMGERYGEDLQLAEKVRVALDSAPVYKYLDVKVNAYKGTVQLSGFVGTEAERKEATAIAKAVRGVIRVENNLVVRQAGDQSRARGIISAIAAAGRNRNPA